MPLWVRAVLVLGVPDGCGGGTEAEAEEGAAEAETAPLTLAAAGSDAAARVEPGGGGDARMGGNILPCTEDGAGDAVASPCGEDMATLQPNWGARRCSYQEAAVVEATSNQAVGLWSQKQPLLTPFRLQACVNRVYHVPCAMDSTRKATHHRLRVEP